MERLHLRDFIQTRGPTSKTIRASALKLDGSHALQQPLTSSDLRLSAQGGKVSGFQDLEIESKWQDEELLSRKGGLASSMQEHSLSDNCSGSFQATIRHKTRPFHPSSAQLDSGA